MGRGRRILRSAGAVLGGALVGILLSLGTDLLLHAAGILPELGDPVPDRYSSLSAAYRTVYGLVGSYLTARLAPDRPMLHALVLGLLGLVANIVGALVTWHSAFVKGHHWYPIALVVLALPTAWAGGRIRLWELRK